MIFSLGMFTLLAFWITAFNRGFASGSGPPCLTATFSARLILVNIFAFFSSASAFLCLMLAHLEWPAISFSPRKTLIYTGYCSILKNLSQEANPLGLCQV